MKTKLLLALLLFSASLSFADPVTKKDALKSANAFLATKNKGVVMKAQAAVATSTIDEVVVDSAFYIFNVGNDNGYVVISGSDRTQEVMGYSDSGTIDPNNMSESLKTWLKKLSSNIKAVENGDTPTSTPKVSNVAKVSALTIAKNVVAPLVQSRWNQGNPYNLYCPTYKKDDGTMSTEPSSTGCVATAMAQIMYFWKWPKEATTTIPGYSSNWNMSRTFDELEPVTFAWDDMTDTYNDNSSEASKKAVATLMHYVGRSIQMGYGPSSGAGTNQPPIALKNYYNYDKNLYYANHDNYTFQDWEDLIYNELAAGRPVLMNADTPDLTGGHEFVCDGYDGNGYYHMNWGWGGLDDGYFLLNVMLPDQQGIGGSSSSDGYSMSQGIVVGVQPPTGNDPVDASEARVKVLSMSTNKTSWETSTASFAFTTTIGVGTNYSNVTSYNIGFSLYDEDGTLINKNVGYTTANVYTSSGKSNITLQLFLNGLADGTYYLKSISRASGQLEWKESEHSDETYIKAVIENTNKITLTVCPGTFDLQVNSFELVGNGIVGSEQKIKVNITNNGDNYYRNTFLVVDNAWGVNGKGGSGNCLAIPAGKTVDVYFKYTPTAVGNHTFVLSTSKSTANSFYSTTLNVKSGEKTTLNIAAAPLNEVNAVDGKKYVYGTEMRIQAKITNTGSYKYESYVKSSEWKLIGNVWYQVQTKKQQISIDPGKDTTVVFIYKNIDLNYTNDFHIDTEVVSANCSGYTFADGILYWTADGVMHGIAPKSSTFTATSDVLAVSVPGTTSVPSFYVADDYNKNLIVYYNEGASVSSRVLQILKKKVSNIVFGTTADEIILNDNADIYIPKTFTAKTIKFTRSVGTVDANSAWSTLLLPFAPTSVTAGGEAIDWFHNSSDTNKGLLVKEFYAAQGDNMYFTNVDKIAENRPYLVSFAGTVNGTSFNQSGKDVVFSATDATVKPTDNASTYCTDYKYVGTYAASKLNKAYTLADNGRKFVAASDATVNAFNAYFVANNDEASQVATLNIITEENTATGIKNVSAENGELKGTVYNLNGVKVASLNSADDVNNLPKGVYIINGKKFVR